MKLVYLLIMLSTPCTVEPADVFVHLNSTIQGCAPVILFATQADLDGYLELRRLNRLPFEAVAVTPTGEAEFVALRISEERRPLAPDAPLPPAREPIYPGAEEKAPPPL